MSTSAFAETVRLETGEVLIGDVTSVTYERVVVTTLFPREEKLTLPANRLDPASHYELLVARIDRSGASKRLELARFCAQKGLFAHAIVEARLAAKLDPKLKPSAEQLAERALESLAHGLLEIARTYFAVEHPARARLYLNSILKRYPRTKSAVEARRLLHKLPKAQDKKEARERISSDREKRTLRRNLERARGYLQRADKKTGSLQRHFRAGKDEHLLRRAAYTYKKAYGLIRKGVRSLTDEEALNEQLIETATTARARLTKAYLELGRLCLQRGSIRTAEEYCSLACSLEPERKGLHGLHEQIVQARIAQRFGGY
tara:strand:- start:1969 stop:2919 length:951 start_codon:yes stop_codon:yes gene_type:complete